MLQGSISLKRIIIGIVVLVIVGGAWYLGSPLLFDTIVDEQLSPMEPQPTVEARGTFKDADSFHRGSGTATIYTLPDGKRILRFEDFAVTNGPALHVYLARSADGNVASGFLDLGTLKGNKGNQNYDIPVDADLRSYRSVVIWCVPFRVTFATASLQ